MDELPPLPLPIDFSVYGLDGTFTGPRYLDVWNRLTTPDGPIWQVVLGHGVPGSPEWVQVITVPKLAAQPMPFGSVGPTGLGDARRMALLEIVVLGSADDPLARASLLRRAAEDEQSFETGTVMITIDGSRLELPLSTHRNAAATYVDLGPVAVAVCGDTDRLGEMSIRPVNDRLLDYKPAPSAGRTTAE